jgi:hypothetical protein
VSVTCRYTLPNPGPLLHFSPPRGAEPRTPPLLCLPASTSKVAGCRSHALFSPPLPHSSAHGHVSGARSPPFPSSRPSRRPSHRGPHRLSTATVAVSPPPPMVRPTYPPPLPYLQPPSPLSSSPAGLGANRSHRRPSLQRGPHRAPPH